MAKSKLRSKKGFSKAEEDSDPIWLLTQLEDIMVRFEEVKPKLFAIDDQMHCIMNLHQGDSTNKDFVNLVTKELKVYEKHGGDFLWGEKQKNDMTSKIDEKKKAYKEKHKEDISDKELREQTRVLKKQLREEIMATAILKRADKK
jgi:hypothetical protein